MFDFTMTEAKYIKQARELIDMIIPELSESVIINLTSLHNIDQINGHKTMKITHSIDLFYEYLPVNSAMELIKESFNADSPWGFCDCLAEYFDGISDISCRICSLISRSETKLTYAIVIYNLKDFNKVVEDIYCDVVGGKKIYIFIETLLRNILYKSSQYISAIEYPQIARDIATHSIDYILCNNLTLPHQDIFILLSSLYYEGSSVDAKIVQISPFWHYSKDVKLENSILLLRKNAHTIRKLLELSRYGYVLVLNKWEIEAITKEESIKDVPHLSFEFLGHMHWQLCMSGKTIFRYQNGRYFISNGRKSTNDYRDSLLKLFPNMENGNIDTLSKVIALAAQQKHGTSIIVTEEAKTETERLCSLNRGIKIEEFDLKGDIEIISALTTIDGAILIDLECKCYGIGLILDGEAICIGNPSRGARYNSIVNYIGIKKNNKKKYMAFIVSEDGMIDVIS